jgi:hypothetical protein
MILRHTILNFMERVEKFLRVALKVNADSQFFVKFLCNCDYKIKNPGRNFPARLRLDRPRGKFIAATACLVSQSGAP